MPLFRERRRRARFRLKRFGPGPVSRYRCKNGVGFICGRPGGNVRPESHRASRPQCPFTIHWGRFLDIFHTTIPSSALTTYDKTQALYGLLGIPASSASHPIFNIIIDSQRCSNVPSTSPFWLAARVTVLPHRHNPHYCPVMTVHHRLVTTMGVPRIVGTVGEALRPVVG